MCVEEGLVGWSDVPGCTWCNTQENYIEEFRLVAMTTTRPSVGESVMFKLYCPHEWEIYYSEKQNNQIPLATF